MHAVEIDEAISALVAEPFDAASFPFEFLASLGVANETTLKRLREPVGKRGSQNKTDLNASEDGPITHAVLQRGQAHIAIASPGELDNAFAALKASPATVRAKAKFILATDGTAVEAEYTSNADALSCSLPELGAHVGYLLPAAGIIPVAEIKNNPVDIKATGALNKLYVELLRANPDWGTDDDKREALNHFMARLIFCFFAEDTNVFQSGLAGLTEGPGLFTATVSRWSAPDGSDMGHVLGEIFRAMDIATDPPMLRRAANLPVWADAFTYVNGSLFAGARPEDIPAFTKSARSYLLRAGELNWRQINPDIFGSMIQAVANDEERGSLGMHYTSVPNILKVLNPLFLDELDAKLNEAGDNTRKLLNLRRRIARIRVFDPACGSGNFLVIAYKKLREIEAEINRRRGEIDLPTEIRLTNFRGIEIEHFPCEVARLALVIAQYQADVQHRGEVLATRDFLPLEQDNWITHGNALRLDWLSVCEPTGKTTKIRSEQFDFEGREHANIDYENEGGETYICGNPPYLGSKSQSADQKAQLKAIFESHTKDWRNLDYVTGWFFKAAEYSRATPTQTALVSTNSICQGVQVAILWPLIFQRDLRITFAYESFKWANLASHNAGVTVVIVGLGPAGTQMASLFRVQPQDQVQKISVEQLNAYLVPGSAITVGQARKPLFGSHVMELGNMPKDGGNLILSNQEDRQQRADNPRIIPYLYDFIGSQEFVRGQRRACLWIEDDQAEAAKSLPFIAQRLEGVTAMRLASQAPSTREFSNRPHRFKQIQGVAKEYSLIVPKVSGEARPFLPVGVLDRRTIISDNAFALYDAPLWNMALIASRIHLVWIATVCGKLETRYRYSNTLGWNTFPVPPLSEEDKAELTARAEDILLAREAHFPATIADLYKPDAMPENLGAAHEANDETLEQLYIGRRFRNDTERLEKLFDMYTAMTTKPNKGAG